MSQGVLAPGGVEGRPNLDGWIKTEAVCIVNLKFAGIL
jgi:hypothetical protein